jgi:hypothetical protein
MAVHRSGIVVDADPAAVLDVIADFEAYEWTGAVREVEILEEFEDGWAPGAVHPGYGA